MTRNQRRHDPEPALMRILHVLDHSIPLHSGYAFRTLAILREQHALGWQTAHLTSAKQSGARDAVEHADGLTFYRTLPSGALTQRLPVLNQIEVVRGVVRRLREIVPDIAPDIIHAHSPALTGVAALHVARALDLPMVYEVRALWEDGAVDHGTARAGDLRYRATRALETWVLKRADAVTTICEGLRREVVARGLPEHKVTVIPNAVDPERFATNGKADPRLLRELGLGEGGAVIGFIGSFYAYEGLALLLRAMPEILRRMPNARLLLVGGGYEEVALKRQATEAGLGERVVFAGRVPHDRVQAYYDLVDVFVYPRERTRVTELVTPLKPLEAMAQGRVVVASDVGGHLELIRDGENGKLFRAGDAHSLADTVVHLLQDSAARVAIAQRARRFVEAERTWARSVLRYRAVYDPLLIKYRQASAKCGLT